MKIFCDASEMCISLKGGSLGEWSTGEPGVEDGSEGFGEKR